MTARATTSRPRAANGTAPAPAPAAFPVLRFTPRTEPAERIPLFYMGDTEYTIPKHPGANIAIVYMEILGEDGGGPKAEARAYTYLFREMLGDEGYEALKTYTDLKVADLGQLTAILVQHTMGAMEAPKGRPASA